MEQLQFRDKFEELIYNNAGGGETGLQAVLGYRQYIEDYEREMRRFREEAKSLNADCCLALVGRIINSAVKCHDMRFMYGGYCVKPVDPKKPNGEQLITSEFIKGLDIYAVQLGLDVDYIRQKAERDGGRAWAKAKADYEQYLFNLRLTNGLKT